MLKALRKGGLCFPLLVPLIRPMYECFPRLNIKTPLHITEALSDLMISEVTEDNLDWVLARLQEYASARTKAGEPSERPLNGSGTANKRPLEPESDTNLTNNVTLVDYLNMTSDPLNYRPLYKIMGLRGWPASCLAIFWTSGSR
jgi:hypothetical protein